MHEYVPDARIADLGPTERGRGVRFDQPDVKVRIGADKVAQNATQVIAPFLTGAAIRDDHFETTQGNWIGFSHRKMPPLKPSIRRVKISNAINEVAINVKFAL
ncbi:hypothetical protein P9281_07375 [Caballeronia sp. LP003]|uniref:hypothetical protein n=1 Tax=Caballeronia sp. LP003 TaxID=3038551 RepID=UPI00285A9273|nr:hypothetical protein [Caballeronia sp. LP003]MDR5786365.1 hypothetical protein [Caballeronia sp. LP003]